MSRSICARADINVGGEQSGHLILSDFATTGDGLLAALQVLAVLVQQSKPASEVLPGVPAAAAAAEECAVHRGLPVARRTRTGSDPRAEMRLNGTGRVLIRESGTEPLVRVMAEGEDSCIVAEVVDQLCEAIAEVARIGEAAL